MKTRADLIKSIQKGEACIDYGRGKYGTLQQLEDVLKECFPEDKYALKRPGNYYYTTGSNGRWIQSDALIDDIPLIKVSEFFQLSIQRAEVFTVNTVGYSNSFPSQGITFLHKPFTPCPEVDVPQTVIEALQVDNTQTIVIGGYIYKL